MQVLRLLLKRVRVSAALHPDLKASASIFWEANCIVTTSRPTRSACFSAATWPPSPPLMSRGLPKVNRHEQLCFWISDSSDNHPMLCHTAQVIDHQGAPWKSLDCANTRGLAVTCAVLQHPLVATWLLVCALLSEKYTHCPCFFIATFLCRYFSCKPRV